MITAGGPPVEKRHIWCILANTTVGKKGENMKRKEKTR